MQGPDRKAVLWPKLALGLLGVVAVSALAVALRHVWLFRDRCVLLMVQESTASALSSGAAYLADIREACVDLDTKTIRVWKKPSLLGVSLLVYRQSFSQGDNLFSDALMYHRKGVFAVDLDYPTEAPFVDNDARVLRNGLVVRKVDSSGTAEVCYGGRDIVLKPGQCWFELLIKTPEGVIRAEESDWEQKYNEACREAWPVTRFLIRNEGLWPKSGIEEVANP